MLWKLNVSIFSSPSLRPGRKPKGFLSFISQKSSSDNAPKPHRTSSQKPQINTARLDRKRTASAPAVDLSSESSAVSPPSAGIGLCASSSSTPAAEGVGSTSSQVSVTVCIHSPHRYIHQTQGSHPAVLEGHSTAGK